MMRCAGAGVSKDDYVRCRQAFEHFMNSTNTEPEYPEAEGYGLKALYLLER